MLITGCSGSWNRNSLFNIINQQPDIDKICLYAEDLNDKNTEEYNPNKKYKLLIVFDNITAEMFSNNQPNLTVT